MYIKINGSDEHYNASITTFSTQHGNEGVRVIGDMPQTDKGFILYDDNDKVFNDLSDFVYSYGNNDNEYTKVEEIIEEAECSFEPLPPSSYDIFLINGKMKGDISFFYFIGIFAVVLVTTLTAVMFAVKKSVSVTPCEALAVTE